jgi:hypothetical protein
MLFNNASAVTQTNIASNERMTGELKTGEDVEVSGHGLI